MWKHVLAIFIIGVILSGCNTTEETGKSTDVNDEKEIEEKDSTEKNDEKVDKQTNEKQKKSVKPKYKINDKLWTIEPIRDDVNQKVALLTIDDAPDEHALEMAKTLKKLDVPAIFFVNGHFLNEKEKQDQLKQIADMGFEIGNHTYSHKSLPELSKDEQIEEIQSVNEQVKDITGKKPDFFRAPFGQNTDVSRQFVENENMHLMNWTYGYDWDKKYQSESAIKDIMVNTPLLNDGANLLMHDRDWTNAALEDIVKGLKEKGYDIVDPKEIEGYTPE